MCEIRRYVVHEITKILLQSTSQVKVPARCTVSEQCVCCEVGVRARSTSVRGLEMPVGECPYSSRGACLLCARGPPCDFFYCTCTTELYCTVVLYSRYIKNDDHHHHEPRTKFNLI